MNGHRAFFLPFYFKLKSDENRIHEMQAQLILELAEQFLNLGYQEVGFMCFTNQKKQDAFQQTRKLNASEANLKISSKMNFQVLSELDKKLESDFFHLRSKFKILPSYSEILNHKAGFKSIHLAERFDLIKPLIENGRGRVLLGWLTPDFLELSQALQDKKMEDPDLFSSVLHRLVWEALSDLQTVSPVPPEYHVLIKEPMYLSDLSQHEFPIHSILNKKNLNQAKGLETHSRFRCINHASSSLQVSVPNQNRFSSEVSVKVDDHEVRTSEVLARIKRDNARALFCKESSFDLSAMTDFLTNVPRSTLQKKSYEFQLAMDMIRTIKTVTLSLSGCGLSSK